MGYVRYDLQVRSIRGRARTVLEWVRRRDGLTETLGGVVRWVT